MQESVTPDKLGRYARQFSFSHIGRAGQEKLRASTVAVIGCGGLGSAAVQMLARAGVGTIVIVDRDFVEVSNLHRQILFDEDDAATDLPKAVAAAQAVKRINSEVQALPTVAEVSPANIEEIIGRADVVIDGTDNFETRYLLNDACVKLGIPWVFGGAVGSSGMSMTIVPGETACFRCHCPDSPPPGTLQTASTFGVIASIVVTVASIQWTEAVKILIGDKEHLNWGLFAFDLWAMEFGHIMRMERRPDCPCCAERRFEFLDARVMSRTTTLRGQNAVQVSPARPLKLDLTDVDQKLPSTCIVTAQNNYLVRVVTGLNEVTVFSDGRAIVKGTTDEREARALYARVREVMIET